MANLLEGEVESLQEIQNNGCLGSKHIQFYKTKLQTSKAPTITPSTVTKIFMEKPNFLIMHILITR